MHWAAEQGFCPRKAEGGRRRACNVKILFGKDCQLRWARCAAVQEGLGPYSCGLTHCCDKGTFFCREVKGSVP